MLIKAGLARLFFACTAVIEHIGKRLHLAPVFSCKLVFMPLDLGHPLWVGAAGQTLLATNKGTLKSQSLR